MSKPAPDFDAVTDWAFALLTMRVSTPRGEWLADDFSQAYANGWRDIEENFKGEDDDPNEVAMLSLVNMAMHLMDWLVEASGRPQEFWLERIHTEYVLWGRDDRG